MATAHDYAIIDAARNLRSSARLIALYNKVGAPTHANDYAYWIKLTTLYNTRSTELRQLAGRSILKNTVAIIDYVNTYDAIRSMDDITMVAYTHIYLLRKQRKYDPDTMRIHTNILNHVRLAKKMFEPRRT